MRPYPTDSSRFRRSCVPNWRVPAAVGAILLEVIIALGLLFVTAGIALSGLGSSLRAVNRTALAAKACDLAVTKLAEIRMDLLKPADEGPNIYEEEDLAEWSWEITVEAVEQDLNLPVGTEMARLEVIITHIDSGYVCRLVRLLPQSDHERALAPGADTQIPEVGP